MEESDINLYLASLLFMSPIILYLYGIFLSLPLSLYEEFLILTHSHFLSCIMAVLSFYGEITIVSKLIYYFQRYFIRRW